MTTVKIYVGLDNGSGTSLSTARVNDQVYQNCNIGYIASGQMPTTVGVHDLHGGVNGVPAELQHLNGKTNLLVVQHVNTGKDWAVGLTTSFIVGSSDPLNPTGLTKYGNSTYMQVMLEAGMQGLLNNGMCGEVHPHYTAELYLCYGLAPEYFYDKESLERVISQLQRHIASYTFSYNDITFIVKGVMVRPESLSIAFDDIIDDGLNISKEKIQQRKLFIDLGSHTGDGVIYNNKTMSGKPVSEPKLGTKIIFETVKDKMNDRYDLALSVTDCENHHYGCDVAKGITDEKAETFKTLVAGEMIAYLDLASANFGKVFENRISEFDEVHLTGGVVEMYNDMLDALNDAFVYGNRPVKIGDTYDNANAFSKLANLNKW